MFVQNSKCDRSSKTKVQNWVFHFEFLELTCTCRAYLVLYHYVNYNLYCERFEINFKRSQRKLIKKVQLNLIISKCVHVNMVIKFWTKSLNKNRRTPLDPCSQWPSSQATHHWNRCGHLLHTMLTWTLWSYIWVCQVTLKLEQWSCHSELPIAR